MKTPVAIPPAGAASAPVSPSTRRGFGRQLGIASLAAGGAALLNACGGVGNSIPQLTTASQTSAGLGDSDYLNFLLNLEYLQAEFYSWVTTGAGISAKLSGGTGTAAATSGGAPITFTDPVVQAIALELAADQIAHVTLLRGLLGAAAVAKPAINLAAGSAPNNDASFLGMARGVEDVCASAYAGLATYLQSFNSTVAVAAALGVESEHSGMIRLVVVEKGLTLMALDSSDIAPSSTAYFDTGAKTGLPVVRTTRQVMDIVYGTPGAASGGFFPAGLNGTITK